MPKRNKGSNDTEAKAPKRRSERLINKPTPPKSEPKPKKAAAKPKKTKDAEKVKPEEKEDVPSENGDAKPADQVPATEENEKKKDDAE